ncbi:uncharacterized protein LOC125219096 [Salvia hispanica]|uniref:uncharacterized protein LOC125219096 n=1 Tax=Salvia hispanica TaxID=49212 RepID=UPI002008EF7B|nr:uncharacterized protein LOC125219096 [Salvia hispanica]
MASSRSKPSQQLNTSIWKVESTVSSSTLMESAHALPTMRNAFDNCLPSFDDNCVYASEFPDSWKNENLTEGWNLVKHPKFPPPPPPPSQTEDVEHWIRAMFIDATKN